MSSEVENIELKGKEKNNTDKLNLSGQTARQPISHDFLTIYKHPMHRKLLSKTLFTLHIHNVSFCVWDIYDGEEWWRVNKHSSPLTTPVFIGVSGESVKSEEWNRE